MKDSTKLSMLKTGINAAATWQEAGAVMDLFKKDAQEPARETEQERTENPDGVYILSDGVLSVFDRETEYDVHCKVAVSYRGHAWIVCKEDQPCGEVPLLKDYKKCEEKSPFYKSEIDALNDFDMESCTDHLRNVENGLGFALQEGELVPTLGQLAAMYFFSKDLNAALQAVDGDPMEDEWYWSSSEFSATPAWCVGVSTGYTYLTSKYVANRVRPCAALSL